MPTARVGRRRHRLYRLETVEARLKRTRGGFHDWTNISRHRSRSRVSACDVTVRSKSACSGRRWQYDADSARVRDRKAMAGRLRRAMDASQNRGNAVKKREDSTAWRRQPSIRIPLYSGSIVTPLVALHWGERLRCDIFQEIQGQKPSDRPYRNIGIMAYRPGNPTTERILMTPAVLQNREVHEAPRRWMDGAGARARVTITAPRRMFLVGRGKGPDRINHHRSPGHRRFHHEGGGRARLRV